MFFFDVETPEYLSDYKLPSLDDINKDIAIKEAERYLSYEVPYIPMSIYMEFSRCGNRSNYENPYFEKRRALVSLTLGERAEGKGRFIDKIIDIVYSILGETTWTVAAHNLYIRDTKALLLPDTERPIIDLFSAETGSLLAVTYIVLKDILKDDGYKPLFKTIEKEVEKRIFIPYLTDHFWWMGNGKEEINNWAPWCTLNVSLAFFLLPSSERMRKKAFSNALYTLSCFIKDYKQDGLCTEGAGYYAKASLCMIEALDVLNTVSGGILSGYMRDEKIVNMVSFIRKVHVSGPYFINYADCSAKPGFAGAREFNAAFLINDDSLKSFAAMQYLKSGERERFLLDEYNFFMRIIAFTKEKEILSYKGKYEDEKDVFFPSSALEISRKGDYIFSIKGGDNNDSHNHNDISSITIYKKDEPFLIDIGVEEYTKKTFSPERYEIWTMRSVYHNTLNFEDIEQKNGKDCYALLLKREEKADGSLFISFDMKNAFRDERVKKYIRRVLFSKEGLSVEEETDSENKKILSFMFKDEIKRDGNTIFIKDRGKLELCCDIEEVKIESFPIDDAKLNIAWGKGNKIYRVQVITTDSNIKWTLA